MFKEIDKEIEIYSEKHPELKNARYHIFNKPLLKADINDIEFVVIGMNPGESKRVLKRLEKPVQEETSWMRKIRDFCGTDNVIQTEAFFWSSKNIKKDFKDRYGYSFDSEPCRNHLQFCKERNMLLISHYKPKAVFAPGLKLAKDISSVYGLEPMCAVRCPETGHRLIEKYLGKDGLPWLFTKHWSGARDFRDDQKKLIKNYIQSL